MTVASDACGPDLDEFARALDGTRRLRLVLNVLYDGMDTMYPAEDQTAEDRFQVVMREAHDRLTVAEAKALTESGFAEHYTVIRPFSLVSLPEPKVAQEITSAIRTLQRHGMLVQQPDALERDRDVRGVGVEDTARP